MVFQMPTQPSTWVVGWKVRKNVRLNPIVLA